MSSGKKINGKSLPELSSPTIVNGLSLRIPSGHSPDFGTNFKQ